MQIYFNNQCYKMIKWHYNNIHIKKMKKINVLYKILICKMQNIFVIYKMPKLELY